MFNALMNFFYMHGHGLYIWNAYGCVFVVLAMQWFISWRRWRYLMRNMMNSHE